eukprot:6447023-Heterocapsa_arctica.AAC.1
MPSSLICRLRIAARPAQPRERTPSCSSLIVHTLKLVIEKAAVLVAAWPSWASLKVPRCAADAADRAGKKVMWPSQMGGYAELGPGGADLSHSHLMPARGAIKSQRPAGSAQEWPLAAHLARPSASSFQGCPSCACTCWHRTSACSLANARNAMPRSASVS